MYIPTSIIYFYSNNILIFLMPICVSIFLNLLFKISSLQIFAPSSLSASLRFSSVLQWCPTSSTPTLVFLGLVRMFPSLLNSSLSLVKDTDVVEE
jgi:hypothetical protein